jgi:hypothetical protein
VSANVRCAGGGWAEWNLGKGRGVAEPCGWKGYRKHTEGWQGPNLDQMAACPWCGGRVELIPKPAS